MPNRSVLNCFALCAAALLLACLMGCARQPPRRNLLSGKRLRVSMRFAAPLDPNNYYFFLMQRADPLGNPDLPSGSINAPGPVPVVLPPYGNGFATGPGSVSGFTDFILFTFPINHTIFPGGRELQGFGLYHVVQREPGLSNNRVNLQFVDFPLLVTPPSQNAGDPNSAVLQFEIDLSQIMRDAAGNALADPNQAADFARQGFLQLGIIATNAVPLDPNTLIDKRVDAMGDTSAGTGEWLTIDVTQNRAYTSRDAGATFEPTQPDVFPANDPTIDLLDWTIEVRQQ